MIPNASVEKSEDAVARAAGSRRARIRGTRTRDARPIILEFGIWRWNSELEFRSGLPNYWRVSASPRSQFFRTPLSVQKMSCSFSFFLAPNFFFGESATLGRGETFRSVF